MSRSQPMIRSAPLAAPAATQRTNRMAVWSLILAIGYWIFLGMHAGTAGGGGGGGGGGGY
jgi:hypothetical protein